VIQEVLDVDIEEELKRNQRPKLVLLYIELDKPEVTVSLLVDAL